MLRRSAPFALLLAAAVWPFQGPLFAGRVLYFRDINVTYFPDFVFVARALAAGVWPFWHPGVDAGSPFLFVYPVHLALLATVGARATLALSPALHLLLAALGTQALARRLGRGRWAAAFAGVLFCSSGIVLGSVLYPAFLAACWAPLAVAALLDLLERPGPRRVAALALVLALQVSTLGVELLPQTALLALALAPRPRGRAPWVATAAALVLAALVAAPALLGALWLLQGTPRGAGFAARQALAYSTSLPALLEAVLPRFLGETHTFSDVGFWGQPFFPGGSPFFLSLYVGPIGLVLAAIAGRREWRLWALVALGVLLSLGANGPFAVLLGLARVARVPAKFLFLSSLALALLSAAGLERAASDRRRRSWTLVPGLLLLALAALAAGRPTAVCAGLARVIPAAAGPLALDVVARQWPAALAVTGALALAAGAALAGGGRLTPLAGVVAVLDLLVVNGGLNPSADATFYQLREPLRTVVAGAREEGAYRWFSYGLARSGGLSWRPEIRARDSDVWLFYLDRQSLLARTHVLDGLEGAYDVDRMGLAPIGSTLELGEAVPPAFRDHRERLRQANVRWVLSFVPLPADLVRLRNLLPLPEVAEPLRLYELPDALPRAFFVPHLGAAPVPGVAVSYEAVDPHTVRLTADSPPGFLVVLDGQHPDWHASGAAGEVPLRLAGARYRALPTPGGRQAFLLRFRPRFRAPALVLGLLGLLVAGVLGGLPGVSEFTRSRRRRMLDSPPVEGS